jgi:hypothetical protein
VKVFLGGTVNRSNWRKAFIRQLEVDYFNPVTDDWNERAQRQELHERLHCDYCLYVITPFLEGFYSLAEVTDDSIKRPRRTLFCFLPKDEETAFSEKQLASLRKISDRVQQNGARYFVTLDDVLAFFNSGEAEKKLKEDFERIFTDVVILTKDPGATLLTDVIEPFILRCDYKTRIVDLTLNAARIQEELLHAYHILVMRSHSGNGSDFEAVAGKLKELRKNYTVIHNDPGEEPHDAFKDGLMINDSSAALSLDALKHRIALSTQEEKLHAHILKKAFIWYDNGRKKNDLLIGMERRAAEQWLQTAREGDGPLSPTELQCTYVCESKECAEDGLTDVFFCYDKQDEQAAGHLYKALSRKALTTWTSLTDLNENDPYEQVARSGIERNSNLLFFVSAANWNNSVNRSLLAYALALNKAVLFISLEEVEEAKKTALQNRIPLIPYHDTECLHQLTALLEEEFAYKKTHRDILIKAIDWERSNFNTLNLLKGFDMQQAENWLEKGKRLSQQPTLLMTRFIHQSQMDQISLFISYARNPSLQLAHQLHDTLIALNYNVWFDKSDIPLGVDFQEQINIGIEKADYFIFVLTPNSIQSRYCKIEIDFAKKYNKRIIPLLHQPVDGIENIDEEIKKINWTDFSNAEKTAGDFESSVLRLKDTLENGKDMVTVHTTLLKRALAWTRNREDEDLLLSFNDLQEAERWLETINSQENPLLRPSRVHLDYINQSRIQAEGDVFDFLFTCPEEDRQHPFVQDFYYYTIQHNRSVKWAGNEHDNRNLVAPASKILFFISAGFSRSEVCQSLLQHANAFKKPLIAIIRDDAHANVIKPDRAFSSIIHYGAQRDLYAGIFTKIHKEATAALTYHSQHRHLLLKALRWERKKDNHAALLRGEELDHFDTWQTASHQAAQEILPLQKEFLAASREKIHLVNELLISYHPEDVVFARKIHSRLIEFEKITWCNQEYLHENIRESASLSAIESAENIILVLSGNYLSTDRYLNETQTALQKNKRVILVHYKSPQSASLPESLRNLASINFMDDFQRGFNELIKHLSTDQAYISSHNEWLRKAIDWHNGERKEDRLLKGVDLELANSWLQRAYTENKKPGPTDLHHQFILEGKKAARRQHRIKKLVSRALGGLVIGLFISLVFTIRFYLNANSARKEAELLAISERNEKEKAIVLSDSLDKERRRANVARGEAIEKMREAITARQETQHALQSAQRARNEAVFNKRLAEKERDAAQRLFRIAESERISKLVAQADISCIRDSTWHQLASGALVAYFINDNDKGSVYDGNNYLAMYNLLHCEKEVRNTFQLPRGYVDGINAFAGNNLMATVQENNASLWQYMPSQDKLRPHALISSKGRIEAVDICPDGENVIIGTQEGLLTLHNVATSAATVIDDLRDQPVIAITSARDGDAYLVACKTRDHVMVYSVRLTDAVVIHKKESFPVTNNYKNTLCFTKVAGQPVLIAGGYSKKNGHHLAAFKPGSDKPFATIKVKNWITSLSAINGTIVTGHEDGSLYLWKLSETSAIRLMEAFPDNGHFIRQVSFYNNQLMACSQDKLFFVPLDEHGSVKKDQLVSIQESGVNSIKGGIMINQFVFTIEGSNLLVKRAIDPGLLASQLCAKGVKPGTGIPNELKEVLGSFDMSCDDLVTAKDSSILINR